SLLQKLTVSVCIFQRYCVAHSKGHQLFVEDQHSLFSQNLKFTKWNRLRSSSLNDLLNAKRSVLGFPSTNKLFGIVWVKSKTANIVFVMLNEGFEIFVNFHHVKDSPFHDMQTTFTNELFILHPHCTGKLHQSK